jgi:hypothetical protein
VSRNSLECLPCILGNHCPPGEDEYFHNYENGDSLIAIGHQDFPWHGEDLGRVPLTMRAWVLQERCLAPERSTLEALGCFGSAGASDRMSTTQIPITRFTGRTISSVLFTKWDFSKNCRLRIWSRGRFPSYSRNGIESSQSTLLLSLRLPPTN